MRTLTLITLLLLSHIANGADKLTQAIEKGLVTKEFLNTLTDDDVPKKWRTTTKNESNERYVKTAFLRGGERVLVVTWNREWTGTRSNMFTAMLYDGKKVVCRIIKFTDGTVRVMPQPKDARTYDLTTSLTEDGRMSVTVMNDGDYFQTVELRGRDTRLLDDLEYTKGAVSIELIAKPLADAIEDEIGKKPKAPKK